MNLFQLKVQGQFACSGVFLGATRLFMDLVYLVCMHMQYFCNVCKQKTDPSIMENVAAHKNRMFIHFYCAKTSQIDNHHLCQKRSR